MKNILLIPIVISISAVKKTFDESICRKNCVQTSFKFYVEHLIRNEYKTLNHIQRNSYRVQWIAIIKGIFEEVDAKYSTVKASEVILEEYRISDSVYHSLRISLSRIPGFNSAHILGELHQDILFNISQNES